LGQTALLSQQGVKVLAATIRQQPIHREVFDHLGVDLKSQSIVALKRLSSLLETNAAMRQRSKAWAHAADCTERCDRDGGGVFGHGHS